MESTAPDATRQLEFLGPPASAATALAFLAEPIRRWFRQSFGDPTPAQRLAWPTLARQKNLLLCAPTGSGKTLAAFLPILGDLLEKPGPSSVRCLYVAPLKALTNDIHKNLQAHLAGIREATGLDLAVRIGLRTGDTSARTRRALWTNPPDIFLTTPESLAVLLSYPSAFDLFAGLRWVVIDEVHALVSNKRGADLSLSLERLAALHNNGIQRVGLSATCEPLDQAAQFLVGAGPPCAIARVTDTTPLHLTVEPLGADPAFLSRPQGFMARLIQRLEPELTTNRTTLVFTNTRSLAERLAWALRQRFPDWVDQIGVHHSALASPRRGNVEHLLKRGLVRVVVSSCSLELGIDIGCVDGVVLVHPPGEVVRLLQRIGRSGHGPGRCRRGLVLTAGANELLEAAVTGASSRSAQAEPFRLSPGPLDVLCQHLLGMAAQKTWSVAEAFELVRRAYPFGDLPPSDFQACLDYLSGRGRDGQPWLPSRLQWEGERFTIADDRTARLLRRNIGTILSEEPRAVRFPNGTAVGQVDDAFADRLNPGDRFLLDGRCLEFRRSQGGAMLVDEVAGRPVVPRWAGQAWPLSAELAGRLSLLRVRAAEALRDGPEALALLLRQDYELGEKAAAELVANFQRQECLSEVPDSATCLVEVVRGPVQAEYYVHTPLNRLGNDALARVLVWRLARQRRWPATSIIADLGFAVFLSGATDLTPGDFQSLLAAEAFDADLTHALADSETLRERFRRVALTGLMLLRHPLGGQRRVGGQDWAERRLFDQVRAGHPDFVLLRQALGEVRQECCDAERARVFLLDLPSRPLHWRYLPHVSPFAESWTQAAVGTAALVETPAEVLHRLHATLTLGANHHAGSS